MKLIPTDVGPLNPELLDVVLGLVCFGVAYGVLSQVLLPRIGKVLYEREQATEGVLRCSEQLEAEAEEVRERCVQALAEARHDAARIRQEATEEGTELIAAARAEGIRERDELIAAGRARIAAEVTAAEAALNGTVTELATELAGRILGEPAGVGGSRGA
ncbi:hypothetical protein ACFYYR_03710 [Streptomyces sp. NPDC001922]|uniref:F0F1 ATP synthase subunit B family protein n=1 Tax=Streptomyces sp. NPDC001922 TaxID=3364624 RepID=UPI0036B36ED5